jgi:hypothetical protein
MKEYKEGPEAPVNCKTAGDRDSTSSGTKTKETEKIRQDLARDSFAPAPVARSPVFKHQ